MSRRKQIREEKQLAAELGDTLAAPKDEGISLEQLEGSYASLIGDGEEPYEHETDQAGSEESIATPVSLELDVIDTSSADDPDVCCPISPTSIVEAILFVGHPENRPISGRHIASLMRGVRSSEIELLVEELNSTYEASGCPYRIERTAGGFQLRLLERFAVLSEGFYGRIREAKLNQAAIEALATVAYGQPITREELKEACDEPQRRAVPQLIRRGLLLAEKQEGRAGAMVYRTTDRFLEMFGLGTLDDLPQPHDLDRN